MTFMRAPKTTLRPRELITANVAAELCHKLSEQGVNDFHFYTLNRASLALSTCRLLGLKPKAQTA